MPYPSRPPSTQAVGAALKRGGISRSEWMPGTGIDSPGYQVRKSRTMPGVVDVFWHGESGGRAAPPLLRMADILLLGAGFRCRVSDQGDRLMVYGRLGPR